MNCRNARNWLFAQLMAWLISSVELPLIQLEQSIRYDGCFACGACISFHDWTSLIRSIHSFHFRNSSFLVHSPQVGCSTKFIHYWKFNFTNCQFSLFNQFQSTREMIEIWIKFTSAIERRQTMIESTERELKLMNEIARKPEKIVAEWTKSNWSLFEWMVMKKADEWNGWQANNPVMNQSHSLSVWLFVVEDWINNELKLKFNSV